MDRKVIMLKDLQLLESIANLSAFITKETDDYIALAMTVEEYVKDPSADRFKIMHDTLMHCTTHFPKFRNARQMQITRLLANGNLRIPNEGNEPELTHVEEPIVLPSNVIQLFGKKDVDKDT